MSGITDFDREHMTQILAAADNDPSHDWDWFTCRLLRLIAHSDYSNRDQLRTLYPAEVAAYEDWLLLGHVPHSQPPESPVERLVRAARAARQYVVDWHSSGREIKAELTDSLLAFEEVSAG